MKLFGIEYQYFKWQCTLKLVQCTENYCLCNEVCVGRQQNHFIIDKIILQNLTRIRSIHHRDSKLDFLLHGYGKRTLFILPKIEGKKRFPPFISVEKNGLLPVVSPYCTDSSMGKVQMSIFLCNVRKLIKIYIFFYCVVPKLLSIMIIDKYNIDL